MGMTSAEPAVTGPKARGRGRSVLGVALQVLLVLLVAATATVSGFGASSGSRVLEVLPVVAVAAIGLGLLALTRFSAFVLLILGVRPVLDLFKLSSTATGTDIGDTAQSRGLDPSAIVGVLFLLAALVWLAGRIRSGTFIRGSRLQTAVLAFLAACLLSVVGAQHVQAAALESLRISTVLVMFVVLNQLITSRTILYRVIATCFVGMLVPLGYTIFGLLIGSPASEVKGSFTRLTGPFSQSNTFARYLAFLIIFGIAIYPHVKPNLKAVMAAVLAVSTLFLLLTLTRTALGGLVIGVVVLAIVQRRKGLGAGLLVVAVLALFAVPGVSARFSTLDSTSPTDTSLVWRLNYWTEVLPLANSNPVTGIGLNGTQFQTDIEKQPHNDFVRAYVETGLIGLGAYTCMLVALVANGRRAVQRAARGTPEHAIGAGALAVSIAFVVGSVAANIMSNVVVLFSLIAFSAAASYVVRAGGVATDEAVPVGSAPRRVTQPSAESSAT